MPAQALSDLAAISYIGTNPRSVPMSDVDPNSSSHRTYPLAFDANGEPLDVPSHAVAWRVRKLAKKAGRPKVIFDAETGRPLELPLAASFDDFSAHVDEQGRYRIEAVDAQGRFIPGCVAVTELAFGEKDDDEVEANQKPADTQQLMQLVAELNRVAQVVDHRKRAM
jgi:hypothetical protein